MSPYTIVTYPMQATVDLLYPQPSDVRPRDIAWALANGAVRFGGHIRGRYSVAQHAELVHDLLAGTRGWPDEEAWKALGSSDQADFDSVRRVGRDAQRDLVREAGLHALLHDGHEAYLGDLIAPLKELLRGLGEPFGLASPWDMLEARHDRAIFERVDLGRYWNGVPVYDAKARGEKLAPRFARVVHLADKEAYRIESKALGSYGTAEELRALPGGRVLGAIEAANRFLPRLKIYGLDDGLGNFVAGEGLGLGR